MKQWFREKSELFVPGFADAQRRNEAKRQQNYHGYCSCLFKNTQLFESSLHFQGKTGPVVLCGPMCFLHSYVCASSDTDIPGPAEFSNTEFLLTCMCLVTFWQILSDSLFCMHSFVFLAAIQAFLFCFFSKTCLSIWPQETNPQADYKPPASVSPVLG